MSIEVVEWPRQLHYDPRLNAVLCSVAELCVGVADQAALQGPQPDS